MITTIANKLQGFYRFLTGKKSPGKTKLTFLKLEEK
jgi:hypothetical protein